MRPTAPPSRQRCPSRASLEGSAAPAGRAPSLQRLAPPGVTVTSGDMSLYRSNGSSRIAASVGSEDASSHEPKPISTPNGLRDLGAERVGSHGREPQRRRDAQAGDPRVHQKATEPSARRIAGLAPAASASEKAKGNSTPARAVLLGNAGAMTPSTRNTL